jgi:gamma-glutamyltranspeptidase/glutathione hydrolase
LLPGWRFLPIAQGGNAADAAVATAAALNVTEPTSTGIGGDCFALYFNSADRKVSALNGSGRSPAALSLERLHKEGLGEELPPFHPYTITVPGACAGWCDLVERFGRLEMSQILAPAIRLAEAGFPVAPLTSFFWSRGVERQLRTAPGGLELTINGAAPQAGQVFQNPGLGRTLRAVAEGGKEAFYQGEIAENIVDVVQQAGGCLSLPDLADHASSWQEPISTIYRGLRIWECPPNGQGIAALLALNILSGYDLTNMLPKSTMRLHLQIEAMRLAFADARWYVADPDLNPTPLEDLLSKEYADDRRKLIDPAKAIIDHQHGSPVASSDTVYLSVIDGNGNACSFINSNYMGFGTGIVPSGLGFTLHNRGHNFSLTPGHPNALAPRKRPYHTIIPAMATRPGPKAGEELFASFGVMGGFMQPQGHMQVVISIVDDGFDPQQSLDQPRFCISEGEAGGDVYLEEGINSSVQAELLEMGHNVEIIRSHERALFGRGQIIMRIADDGVLWGGSDPRADGCAMSL